MADETTDDPSSGGPRQVSFGEAARVWLRVAALSFGGPAGQMAVMHRLLVEEKRWVSEKRFLHALNYCMLLPGPEAQQAATYFGWLLHGVRGGLFAGCVFILPGFVSILILSILYAELRNVPVVEALFFGLKAAVLAIVFQAVVRIGRKALGTPFRIGVAVAAFAAIFFFAAPFPLIVISAGLLGFLGARLGWISAEDAEDDPEDADAPIGARAAAGPRPTLSGTLRTAALWGAVWLVPVAALVLFLGRDQVFAQQALFFSKAAVVGFGGAYAVLAYIAQQAVEAFGWMAPGEMLDGLGMAETTPGPLIQVVQFVGFLGAYREAGALSPLTAGVVGSLVVTWVTFAPCFLWIFAGAPYVEALRGRRELSAALATITAAVVGVIVNVAVWFGLHVLFGELREVNLGPLEVLVPELSSLLPAAAAVAALSCVALFGLRWGMGRTLILAVAAGLVARFLGWT